MTKRTKWSISAAICGSIIALLTLAMNPAQTAKPVDINNAAFHEQLLDIASRYNKWEKVDDLARIAPTLCAMPLPRKQKSKSDDSSTHGQKMYFLYVKDKSAYLDLKTSPVGQVVVKESWEPAKISETKNSAPKPSEIKHGLFIMTKVDPKTPDTDNGWIYGTVSADGKTVTSSGRVQSCMSCHDQTANDRLFGIK